MSAVDVLRPITCLICARPITGMARPEHRPDLEGLRPAGRGGRPPRLLRDLDHSALRIRPRL